MSTENTAVVAQVKKDISTQVLDKIAAFQASGELTIPKEYNVENALKSAYIILSDPKVTIQNTIQGRTGIYLQGFNGVNQGTSMTEGVIGGNSNSTENSWNGDNGGLMLNFSYATSFGVEDLFLEGNYKAGTGIKTGYARVS